MTDQEIKEMLHYYIEEHKIYIPNEIFNDLSILEEKGSGYIAFAYSYYYLINWLYRYTKYGEVILDAKMFKRVLGYNSSTKGLDYIIKKGGVLDSIHYTKTTSDYPVMWLFNSNQLEITTVNELDSYSKEKLKERHTNRFSIKYPIKSFARTIESEIDHDEDGTYFDVSNTHEVSMNVFIFCMSIKELGCTGFYLWSYLKMMNQMFKRGYDVSLSSLSTETNISRMTMCRYLDTLKQHNMISTIHNQEYFSPKVKSENRKSNTYITNDFANFSKNTVSYKKISYSKQVDTTSVLDELFL